MNKNIKDTVLFLAPLILFVSVFMLLPILGTFKISFWQDVSFLPKKFIGLTNYTTLVEDREFWYSSLFTIIFCLVSVSIEMVLGILVALVINEKFHGRGIIRAMVLLPWAIPTVIGARIWQLIYRYEYGLANYLMDITHGLTFNWLGSSTGAFISLVIADTWKTTPFISIIILAGLQGIPDEIYEHAKIDGANILRRFKYITLPSLRPVIIVALLFRSIDALRVFDIIYVITGGGPGGSTTNMSLYSYKYFLSGDFGYGSASSIILFFIAFSLSLIYIKVSKFRESVS